MAKVGNPFGNVQTHSPTPNWGVFESWETLLICSPLCPNLGCKPKVKITTTFMITLEM